MLEDELKVCRCKVNTKVHGYYEVASQDSGVKPGVKRALFGVCGGVPQPMSRHSLAILVSKVDQ